MAPRFCESHKKSDYLLVIYVSAKYFDYRTAEGCLKSLAKNSDGRFGHTWVAVHGLKDGLPITITGGHSGELGVKQPRYFDGVAALIEAGDPNPIRYLFEAQQDGFFQEGSGGHTPTFSACKEIAPKQFERILAYMQDYPYYEYALTGRQCTSFVIDIAALADWPLEGSVTVAIPPTIRFAGSRICLWLDPRYSTLTFCTPDRLEQSLRSSF